MESRRDKRKRDWQLQRNAAEQARELRNRLQLIMKEDITKRSAEDCEFLIQNESLVAELSANSERRIKRRAMQRDRMDEKEECPSTLQIKVDQLYCMVMEACNHGGVVVHTGAGLSTSAGIPDFRGPKGVWTLGAKGQAVQMHLKYEDARPTQAHMAIAELVRRGIVRRVVTQNVDGLHGRSGIPTSAISELHGCVFKERCESCGAIFRRPFDTTQPQGSSYHRHKTGRKCGESYPEVEVVCLPTDDALEDDSGASGVLEKEALKSASSEVHGNRREVHEDQGSGAETYSKLTYGGRNSECNADGESKQDVPAPSKTKTEVPAARTDKCGGALVDTIVHFGEKIDSHQLEAAKEASSSSGLALCLGTSLKVPPANKLPRLARRLVIVNLQWTAQDKQAHLKINGRIDLVMCNLAARLAVGVPCYSLKLDPFLGAEGAPSESEEEKAIKEEVDIQMDDTRPSAPPLSVTTCKKKFSRMSFPKPLQCKEKLNGGIT